MSDDNSMHTFNHRQASVFRSKASHRAYSHRFGREGFAESPKNLRRLGNADIVFLTVDVQLLLAFAC